MPNQSTVAPWSSNIFPIRAQMGSASGGSPEITLGRHSADFGTSIRLEFVLVVVLQGGVLLVLDEIAVAGCQYVDLRAHEATEGVLGRAYDRLATHVEAGVDRKS